MAREKISEKIARLELEKTTYNAKLKQIAHIKESEEGGGDSKFKTAFDARHLDELIEKIDVKLTALYISQG